MARARRRHVVEENIADRISAEEWARVQRIDRNVGSGRVNRIERNTGRRSSW
jgi:hypothetical protein